MQKTKVILNIRILLPAELDQSLKHLSHSLQEWLTFQIST